MNVINSVLKSVPKNSDGFEEIDLFWNATEKLAYPLEKRIQVSLFHAKSVTTPAKSTPQKVDSDVEFNYDTSSTISDDQEDDDEEEESESEDDKDEYDDVPSPEQMSVKTNKSQSIITSGVKSSRSSIESSVYSPLNESLGTIGLSPLGTTATNGSIRQSLESGVDGSDVSGRDSLLSRGTPSTVGNSTRNSIAPTSSGKKSVANSSTVSRRNESDVDVSATGALNDSSFFADRSEDMNETGVQSEFGFGQRPPTSTGKGRRASANRDSLATPGSPAKSSNMTNLPSATKGARSTDRSGLRVSFSGKPELEGLSPIAGSARGSVDTGASKRSQSRNSSLNESLDLSPNESINSANTSRNTTKTTSRNTTKNTTVNESVNTTATSVRSSGSELQQSRDSQNEEDNGSFGDDNVDEYGEYEDPEDPEPEQEEEDAMEESMSRIQSQTDTPTTNRSSSRSGLGLDDSSEMRTPHSAANRSSTSSRGGAATGSSRRGGSMSMISTPGSNEFVRGYRVPDDLDASGMSGINDLSTDEEEDLDETGAFTRERNGKKGRGKKHTVTDGEEDELNTTSEISKSFIDPDFLNTISSANKKYVHGREILKQHKPKPAPSRRSKVYHSSDDEEEGGQQRGSSEEDSEQDGVQRRRSKRATKGQRFAYWKGERPIYEEGTMVGLITVDPTPQKRKRVVKVTEDGKAKRTKKARAEEESDQEEEARTLPTVRLPKNVRYKRREECDVLDIWDEVAETQTEDKVFCSAESLLPPIALPRTAKRQPGRDKVGFAAHSFNVPEVPGKMSGWLSGFIDLPPDAIKDAEGVGRFTQVFFVSDCQDGALELGLSDPSKNEWVDRSAQRVLLKKGDCFYVPPGNIYRLENHSTAKSSKLNWVIIKPLEQGVDEDEEFDGEEEGSVISNGSIVGDSPDTTGALLDGRGAGRRVAISVEEDM